MRFRPSAAFVLSLTALLAAPVAAAEAPTAPSPEAAALRQALADAVDSPDSWESLHLMVACQNDAAMRTVEVFGNGVAIWDFRRQFTLEPKQISSLLASLHQADLVSFKDVYGGRPKGDPKQPEEPSEFAIRVLCRIELKLAGQTKQVAQLGKGEESLELKKLAHELLDACEGPAADGIVAADLTDGLQKVARGELAPDAMRVLLYRKPDDDAAAADDGGFLLRLTGHQATRRDYPAAEGLAKPVELQLSGAEVAAVARELAEAGVAGLPANLFATDYRDLSVQVLNHKKTVTARAFEGMTAATHASHQQSFERIYAALDRLQQRVAAGGQPMAESGP